MATIWANRRPIRAGAARSNERNCRISPIPRAPGKTMVLRQALAGKMATAGRPVEGTAKIATRVSAGRSIAVDSLHRSGRQRPKSSPPKRTVYGYRAGPPPLARRKSKSPLEPFGVGRPNPGVDDARRPLAVEHVEH